MTGRWGHRHRRASCPTRTVCVSAQSLALAGCAGNQSILGSQSPGAAAIESLWWISLAGTGVLAVLVIAGLLYAVRRAMRVTTSRPDEDATAFPPPPPIPTAVSKEDRFILLMGAGIPALFLIGFLAVSVRTGAQVATPEGEPGLTIEVVGHKFWWEVRYPEQGIVTANELHIPVGEIIHLRVTSADVIHSFWVPQLSPGKIDMVPGRTNTIWMLATEAGRYRGQCTEFCGVQHALMSMSVTAHEPDAFEAWIDARQVARSIPTEPEELEGVSVFFAAGCATCHAIEGVREPDPRGMAGPNLTHLASRETLAARTIPNDREHLTAWIVDPHQFKSGVRMPATPLGGTELAALVSYLETLE